MRISIIFLAILVVSVAFSAWGEEPVQTAPSVNDNELVKSLSSKLSIKPEQAAGGAGSIFNYAKGKLSPEDFGKVSAAVPGMDDLLKSAPKTEPPKTDTTYASGMLSQATPSLPGIASLAGPFKTLGMGPEMVGKFVPEVLGYVQGKGGDATKSLLTNVLK